MLGIRNAFVVLAIATAAVLADMPKELKGTWILDAGATAKYVQTSPKWKAEDAKMLPMILKRMSQILYEFKDDAMVVTRRGMAHALPVVLKEQDGKKYVFEGKIRDQAVTVTVLFVSDTTISVRYSTTNDMDYYLWKRGTLPKEPGPSDKALALEAMKQTMQKPAAKPDASEGK